MVKCGCARATAAALIAACCLFVLISCSQDYASIEGKVLLADQENHEGTQVYLPGTPYQAITDREGSFKLPEVENGDYELVARREGYTEYRKTGIRARRGSPLRLIPFSLEPERAKKDEGTLEGRVRLIDGSSPLGALVIVENASRVATVGPLGGYSVSGLKAGAYSLVAVKAGYVAERGTAEVVVGATTPVEPLILGLARTTADAQSTGALSGRVEVLGGGSQAGVLVAVEGTSLVASTDTEGLFGIANVPSGTYSVRFQKNQFFPYRTTNVFVEPDGETELEVTLRPIPTDSLLETISRTDNVGSIRGFIAVPDAASMEGAEVILDPLGLAAETAPNGGYTFPAVPAGVYSISARREGYRSGILMGIRVEPGEEAFPPQLLMEPVPVEQLPPKPSSVQGIVLLEGEDLHLGVLVTLVDTRHTALTATDGSYRFEQVMPGNYELLAVKEGFEPVGVPVEVPTNGDAILRPITLKRVIIRPVILDTVPRNGEREVPVDDYVQIIVQFDQAMDGASVKRAFRISPQVDRRMYFGAERASEPFRGVWSSPGPDSDALMLQRTEEPPTSFDRLVVRLPRYGKAPVDLDQKYQVTITEEAKNPKGIALGEPYEFTFTTGGARLTASWPEDGATNVFLLEYDSLVFDFNATINRELFQKAFHIRPKTDTIPLFLPEKAPAGDRVKVEVALRENTRYTVEVDRSLRTRDGKRIENLPYRIQFDTTSIETLGDEEEYYEDLFEGEFGRGGSARRQLRLRAERERRY